MSKTIRFLGGPADQEVRAVPDDVTRLEFCQYPNPIDLDKSIDPNEKIELTYHVYLEAFDGSAYFQYQGEENRKESIVPGWQDWMVFAGYGEEGREGI